MPTPGSCHAQDHVVRRVPAAGRGSCRLRRELDRVGHQVVEHLLEVIAIGGHRTLDHPVELDLDRVRRGRHLQPLGDLADQPRQVDRLPVELELARLDPRDVQQLVDQPPEPRGLRVQQLESIDVAALLVAPLRVVGPAELEPPPHPPQQHLGESRDRRQRRLQLVRGHRQEPRLEPIELLQLLDVGLRVAVQVGDLRVGAGEIVHALLQLGRRPSTRCCRSRFSSRMVPLAVSSSAMPGLELHARAGAVRCRGRPPRAARRRRTV